MNTAQLYSDAIGRKPKDNKEEIKKEVEQDEWKIAKLQWLADPFTQKFFKDLNDRAATLMNAAVNNALIFNQSKDYEIILRQLVELNTLKEVIKKYGNNS